MPSRFLFTLSAFLLRAFAIAAACFSVAHAQQVQPAQRGVSAARPALTRSAGTEEIGLPARRIEYPTADIGRLGYGRLGKRLALVIGNNAYRTVGKLDKADNDATAMARELGAAGFEVQLHHDLNYRGMVKAVESFVASITGGDQVVVYFAGHGVQIKTGSYLLPIDIEATSESEIELTSYGLNTLTDKLSEARAAFTLVIVDACRDNPLKSYGRSIGNTRGLSAIEPPRGEMVVYSASKGQQALDRLSGGDTNPNGIFTRELIAKMRRPGLRIEDLVREVQDSVESLARSVNHEQRPAIYNEARGSFYFYAPGQVPIVSPVNTRDEIEDIYRERIKGGNGYANGASQDRYAGQAQNSLRQVKSEPRRSSASEDPETQFWEKVGTK